MLNTRGVVGVVVAPDGDYFHRLASPFFSFLWGLQFDSSIKNRTWMTIYYVHHKARLTILQYACPWLQDKRKKRYQTYSEQRSSLMCVLLYLLCDAFVDERLLLLPARAIDWTHNLSKLEASGGS